MISDIDLAFMETSACKSLNVEEAFQLMIRGNYKFLLLIITYIWILLTIIYY